MERIPEKDDKLNIGVGMNSEISVTAWKFVNFINHQNASALQK